MLWCAVTSCSVVLHFTAYRQQICKDASCFHNESCFVTLLSVGKLISLPFMMYFSLNVCKLCLYLMFEIVCY